MTSRRIAIALGCALASVACRSGGGGSAGPAAPLRPACDGDHAWNGARCEPRGDGAEALARGAEALAAFRVEEALALLEQARAAGPHAHETLVAIHEQLGIAHAYLGDEQAALAAFDTLLHLDPGHLLSYTLSPKATFLFERARRAAADSRPPGLDVSWPRDLEVTRPVPIDVEVVADPRAMLRAAALHVRRRGEASYRAVDLALPAPGAYERVVVPALGSTEPETLEIYLTAFDDEGNEVLRWGDPSRPRELTLTYDPPTPWYRKWWVWAIAGGTVATATGTTVFLLTRDLPDEVGGDFEF